MVINFDSKINIKGATVLAPRTSSTPPGSLALCAASLWSEEPYVPGHPWDMSNIEYGE